MAPQHTPLHGPSCVSPTVCLCHGIHSCYIKSKSTLNEQSTILLAQVAKVSQQVACFFLPFERGSHSAHKSYCVTQRCFSAHLSPIKEKQPVRAGYQLVCLVLTSLLCWLTNNLQFTFWVFCGLQQMKSSGAARNDQNDSMTCILCHKDLQNSLILWNILRPYTKFRAS